MEFGGGWINKDGSGFDLGQPDTQVPLPHPTPTSSDPSPFWDFPIATGAHAGSYFSGREDDPGWACQSEQLWGDLHGAQSTLNSIPDNAPCHSDRIYNDVSRSSLASSRANSSNCHVDLAKITENEKWNTPAPGEGVYHTAPRMQHHSYSSTPSPQPLARSNSDGSKPLGRSRSSTFSEGQSRIKRRQSWDAHSMPDPGVQIEEKIDVVKSKTSSKRAHSVVERRYRENINTKINQLDQLLSMGDQKSLDSDEMPIEPTAKVRKADVLTDAIRYVKQTALESEARTQEISFLRLRVAALEKLVNCSDCSALKHYASLQVAEPLKF